MLRFCEITNSQLPISHMRRKERQSLETILASVSDVLYPDKMGAAKVAINSVDCEGDTPLHILVRRPNRYAVMLLLENGADPNAIGDMGETPLHVAVSIENSELVKMLLENGADPDIVCEFGDTPKQRAVGKSKKLARIFGKAL